MEQVNIRELPVHTVIEAAEKYLRDNIAYPSIEHDEGYIGLQGNPRDSVAGLFENKHMLQLWRTTTQIRIVKFAGKYFIGGVFNTVVAAKILTTHEDNQAYYDLSKEQWLQVDHCNKDAFMKNYLLMEAQVRKVYDIYDVIEFAETKVIKNLSFSHNFNLFVKWVFVKEILNPEF